MGGMSGSKESSRDTAFAHVVEKLRELDQGSFDPLDVLMTLLYLAIHGSGLATEVSRLKLRVENGRINFITSREGPKHSRLGQKSLRPDRH